VLSFLRRFLRRPAAETEQKVGTDATISRAAMMTRGARAGDAARFRPSQGDRDLADRLGVDVHDPTDRRL
jgi:hypothetical protein